MMPKTKVCTKCKIEKSLNEFYKDRQKPSGLCFVCKACLKLYNSMHKEKHSIYQKRYSQKHKEEKAIYYRKYKEEKKSYSLKYRTEHKEECKAYRQKNKEKINRRMRQRCKKDIKFKLNKNISRGIRRSLKDGKERNSWKDLVPYTVDQLRKHLEKRFTKDMTWDRFLRGEIHIDHKIPISVFNFTNPRHEDFKKCWALKNLQPMWAKKNMIKNNRIDKHFQPSLLLFQTNTIEGN